MGMITCPGCKKIVNDSSGKCPNCGVSFKEAAKGKNESISIFGRLSSAFIMVGGILLFIELFEIAKTYVGGLLVGAGFVFHGVNQSKMVGKEGYIGKGKVIAIIIIGAVIFLGGIFYFYMDLR